VEWVEYDKEDFDMRLNHIRRIDDLARMIHTASDRHPDLHTLDCLGYTDDTTTSRYGLLYKAPEASSSNLNTLIMSNEFRTPDLGDRFRLAHTLAVALWSLRELLGDKPRPIPNPFRRISLSREIDVLFLSKHS